MQTAGYILWMRRPPFRLHHIALLNAVMQSQTLTEAAKRMHISQPAVSKQIKQLQQDLGFTLFERVGHRLVATFEAHAMLDQVHRLNASLEVLNKLAADLGNERRGDMQIGCIASVASHVLPEALRQITNRSTQSVVTVHTGTTAQVIEWVQTQQVDIGIALDVRDSQELGFTHLVDLRLAALLPSAHPLAKKRQLKLQDLAGHAVIAVELPLLEWPDSYVTRWDEGLDAVVVRVDASNVACRMVQAGLGIAVADSLTVAAFARPPLVRRPIVPALQTSIGIYRSKYRPRPRMLENLVTAVIDRTQQLLETASSSASARKRDRPH